MSISGSHLTQISSREGLPVNTDEPNSREWHPQAVKEAINFLKPENMIIFLGRFSAIEIISQQAVACRPIITVENWKESKHFQTTKVEKWYGHWLFN